CAPGWIGLRAQPRFVAMPAVTAEVRARFEAA
ncbi:glutathione S-transferase, partial [Stenotrophomonas maltophilia]